MAQKKILCWVEHHWLKIEGKYNDKRKPIAVREIGPVSMTEGEGDYGSFQGLAKGAAGHGATII